MSISMVHCVQSLVQGQGHEWSEAEANRRMDPSLCHVSPQIETSFTGKDTDSNFEMRIEGVNDEI
jgi:hypothetical protein